MKKTVKFGNKRVAYGNDRWLDDDCYIFDFGDGELKDKDGDDYFIHLEYYPKQYQWKEEVWYEDDIVSFGLWTTATNQLRKDLDKIEFFILTNQI